MHIYNHIYIYILCIIHIYMYVYIHTYTHAGPTMPRRWAAPCLSSLVLLLLLLLLLLFLLLSSFSPAGHPFRPHPFRMRAAFSRAPWAFFGAPILFAFGVMLIMYDNNNTYASHVFLTYNSQAFRMRAMPSFCLRPREATSRHS